VREVRNHVLRLLHEHDPQVYDKLVQELQPVPLHPGVQLSGREGSSEWVHFVESGVVSMVGEAQNGSSVEVALVGREGVVGIADVLGTSPVLYRLTVQLSGLAYRARAEDIREQVFTCRALHDPLLSYTQSLMTQLTQSVICARFHSAVERLARWLLLTAERAETTALPLTHETLAQMVGAPRSAVTVAAAALREGGLIDYQRGRIEIRNASRLAHTACECYRILSLNRTTKVGGAQRL
jgi:CRP-like cAMP-binding protein